MSIQNIILFTKNCLDFLAKNTYKLPKSINVDFMGLFISNLCFYTSDRMNKMLLNGLKMHFRSLKHRLKPPHNTAGRCNNIGEGFRNTSERCNNIGEGFRNTSERCNDIGEGFRNTSERCNDIREGLRNITERCNDIGEGFCNIAEA